MKLNILPLLKQIPALFLILLTFSCQGTTGTAHHQPGSVKVEADSALDLSQVSVEWIGPNLQPLPVFSEGKALDPAYPAAEKDVFEVYVQGKHIGGGGIQRSAGKGVNHFTFHIRQKDGRYQLAMKVEGPDSINDYFLKRIVRDMSGHIARREYFDARGRKTLELSEKRNRNGELETEYRTEFVYDEQDLKTSQRHLVYSAEGRLLSRIENGYTYDTLGREASQTFKSYGQEGQLNAHNVNKFVYDQEGRMEEKEFIGYSAEGEKLSHFITVYVYNEKGQDATHIQYDGERVLMNRVDRQYDDTGAVIREEFTEFLPDGSVKSRHGREYNEKGRVMREW
jgi:hypothetical protein